MAVILVLDRANIRGKKRPTVEAIVCDGYVLYAHKETGEKAGGRVWANGTQNPAEIARLMLGDTARPLGEAVFHEMREELARQGAEGKARALAERQKKKWQEAEARGDGDAG